MPVTWPSPAPSMSQKYYLCRLSVFALIFAHRPPSYSPFLPPFPTFASCPTSPALYPIPRLSPLTLPRDPHVPYPASQNPFLASLFVFLDLLFNIGSIHCLAASFVNLHFPTRPYLLSFQFRDLYQLLQSHNPF